MDVNYMHPEIKDQGLLVLYPEPKDMYHCHTYHFMEICKPPFNEPIGSYQIHHLKGVWLPLYSQNGSVIFVVVGSDLSHKSAPP